jgi:hypothetical protein
MKGKAVWVVGGVVVATAAALYPIVIAPLMDNGSAYGTLREAERSRERERVYCMCVGVVF